MAAQNFSAIIEAKTRGTAEVQKLEEALTRLMDSTDRAAKKSSDAVRTTSDNAKRVADNTRQSIDKLRSALTNPLEAAGDAVDGLFAKMGRGGIVLAGVATGAGLAGAGLLSMARHAASTAAETTRLATQLNLTVSQAEKLRVMSNIAGTSFETLEEGIERISEAFSQPDSPTGTNTINSLKSLGVAIKDSGNKQREVGQIFFDSLKALSQVKDANERIRMSLAILGESGAIALQPLITKYDEFDKAATRAGAGGTPELTKRLSEADKQVREMSAAWDQFKQRLSAKISPIVIPVLLSLTPTSQESRDQDTRAFEKSLRENRERAGDVPYLSQSDIRSGTSRFLRPGQAEAAIANRLFTADRGAKDRRKIDAAEIKRLVEEKDDQARLAAAQKDLQQAIDYGNLAQVKAAQARIKGIERQIELASEEKKTREKLATFKLDEDKLGPDTNINRSTRVPSLLSNRERILRGGAIGGDFTLDTNAYNDANAGRLAAQNEGDKLYLGRLNDRGINSRAQQLATLQQSIELESRRIELITGPGGEMAAASAIAALRISSLNEQIRLGRDIFDAELERVRIVREHELRILEIRKQQKEEGRNAATSLFDAAVAGGGGLRSFLLSQALQIPRTIAGNLGAEMGGLTGRFSLGLGGLPGRLLQGTPFGADPLKQAGDVQLTAAQIQLQAAQMNVTGRGGAAGGFGGAMGSLGTIFGGSTGNPFIFNALSRSSTPGIQVTDALGLTMPTLNVNGTVSGAGRWNNLSKGVGIAGTLAAGAFGAYSGFSAGGVQGALTGSSSIFGSAAGLLPLLGVSGPAAPILGAIALGLGGLSAILGNPKEKEARRIDTMLEGARFTEATGRSYTRDIYGGQIDYDRTGGMRVTYVYYQPTVPAMDQRGVQEFFDSNRETLTKTISDAVNGGQSGDFLQTMRQQW